MTEVIEEAIKCPLCNNNIADARLALIGLSQEELRLLREHVKNRTIKEMLSIAKIALDRLDPERLSTEFQVSEAMSKLRQVSEDMAKKSMNEAKQFVEKYGQAKEKEKADITKEYGEKGIVMMRDFQGISQTKLGQLKVWRKITKTNFQR